MKRLMLAALALLFAGSGLAADPERPESRPESFSAVAPLQLKPGEALQRLALPWSVLQASRSSGLADVRIFDAEGRAVPQAWALPVTASEQQRDVALPVFAWPESGATGSTDGAPVRLQLSSEGRLLSLQLPAARAPAPTADGRARQWLLDLSALQGLKDERALALQFDWPSSAKGLARAVQIERSDDGQQWSASGQGLLLELPAANPPRIDRIEWASSAPLPRYLRLRFDDPIALKSAQLLLSRRLVTTTPLQQQSLRFEPVAGEPAQWQLDLQGRIAPQALALQLPEGNQLLRLRLEQRNAESEAWRPVAHFVAWRMQRGGVDGRSPAQPLAAEPARYWRLVAEAPTALQGQALPALWQWQPPQLVLLAQGQGSSGFRLAVGRSGLASASVSTLAGLMPGYRPGDEYKLPEASLGALQAQAEPGLQQRLADPDPATRRRWALWAVLIAAVAGLAWMARGLLGQLGKPPRAPGGE
ncbi:DUF3999 family protein [Pelomonas sp. V22]|uniref:DUF3999 family protein n=1 Tax=Pelomonas sp. V22 TaxID=2822139 RepID=UPI0024A8E935|nr:DUF3999 family protein [Pelomonas sp. V22]MDI4635726.1 DUF3999 family protein [Pelomonas sp. V22]